MKILQFPLTRVCIFFVLGLLLYQEGFQPKAIQIFIALLLSLSLLSLLHFKKKYFGRWNGFGGLVCLISVGIGLSTATFHQENKTRHHYLHQTEDQAAYNFRLIIHEKLKNTPKNERYIAIIERIDNQKRDGTILLNIRHSTQNKTLHIGSRLNVEGLLYRNKAPFNPNQFDYSHYLENQQIYAQIYASWPKLKVVKTGTSIWSKFSNFRSKIIDNLKRSNFNSK